MPALSRFAVRAPVGRLMVAGVGILRCVEITLTKAVSEIRARSGCDATDWFRDVDTKDLSGSLTIQDLSPDLDVAVFGGTLVAAASGYILVDRQAITVATAVVALTGAPLLNADGTAAVVLWTTSATGETVLKQIAPDGTPASGEWCYNTADPDALKVNADLNAATVYASYAYSGTSGKSVKVYDTSQPPLVSLLLPACGAGLTAQGTKSALGLYLPRVRFTGRDFNFGAAGAELQGQGFSFVVLPGSDGLLYHVIYPAT